MTQNVLREGAVADVTQSMVNSAGEKRKPSPPHLRLRMPFVPQDTCFVGLEQTLSDA